MASKLSTVEKTVLRILENSAKGTMNVNQVWSVVPVDSGIKKDDVYKALLKLVQKNKAEQPSKGHFRSQRVPVSEIGVLMFTRSGDAYLQSENAEGDDLFIPAGFLNTGLPGDTVEVATLPGKRKRNAQVVRVIKRSEIPVTGELDIYNDEAWLLPDHHRFPYDIRLTQSPGAEYDGFKASAIVTEFTEQMRNPKGIIADILGRKGTNDAEMHSIVAEYGFRIEFSEEVQKECDAIPENIPEPDKFNDRRDLRDTLTFTIDPADAKDFDDALSYRKLADNEFEVGIHIADVSHYVVQNSSLDKEAFLRGTSVYLVDRTIPMLPEKLSNDLCSLKPHIERLAFSVIVKLNASAQVKDIWIGKTLIHSDRRFSYEEAQDIISAGNGEFSDSLLELNALAKKLKQQRADNGAMSFESDEIRFELDNQGVPLKIKLKKRFDAHKLIEEFMLLANRLVAEFVHKKHTPPLPFVYRIHDTPTQEKLMELMRFCQLFGYKIDISSTSNLRNSLNKLFKDIEGKPEEDVIVQTAIRSMAKAIYTGQKSAHFGLAFDYYTHFTSPIRRYPDLLAHRILNRILTGEKINYTQSEVEAIAKRSSMCEQKASEAERASIKYKMAEYLKNHIGQVFQAVISGITEWGVYAEIVENHCEGLIRLTDLRGDHFVYKEGTKKMVGVRTKKTLSIGDLIEVKVKSANPQLRQIDFVLIQS